MAGKLRGLAKATSSGGKLPARPQADIIKACLRCRGRPGARRTVLRSDMERITMIVMRTISLKLPESLLTQLEGEAKARGVTKSRLIREGLETVLRQQSGSRGASCYDLARDLAGSVKGLPKDLAENPKYMEDFGR